MNYGARTVPKGDGHHGHVITYTREPPQQYGALYTNGGTRASCSCSWSSDCYAMTTDTDRAVEVHLRRTLRDDFNALLERSSIGSAIADIKKRGIDAHMTDLEHQPRQPQRARKASRAAKPSPIDDAFMRGFGVALASIWRCHHDGQMVEHLLKENGFTFASFKGVDLLRTDYDAICQALKSRKASTS